MRMVELLTSFARTGKPSIAIGGGPAPLHLGSCQCCQCFPSQHRQYDDDGPGSSKPPANGLLGRNASVLERRQKQLCSSTTYSQKGGALVLASAPPIVRREGL